MIEEASVEIKESAASAKSAKKHSNVTLNKT
jgi:hypothetical protein